MIGWLTNIFHRVGSANNHFLHLPRDSVGDLPRYHELGVNNNHAQVSTGEAWQWKILR